MHTKKKSPIVVIVALVIVLAVAIAAATAVWYFSSHIVVAGRAYSKTVDVLDLRGTGISAEEYDSVREKVPNSEILWEIPFQDTFYAQNTDTLTISKLTDSDIKALDYFTALKKVNADGCTDYPQLLALAERRPEVEVSYTVNIGGKAYAQDAAELKVDTITEEEIGLLAYLPKLASVTITGSETPEQLTALQTVCREKQIKVRITIGGKEYADTTAELSITDASEADMAMLQYLPELKTLHLVTPEASAETLQQLREVYPGVGITWEQEVAGMLFPDDTTEFDLSGLWEKGKPVSDVTVDLEELSEALSYFPEAEQVFFGLNDIDNEKLAAFREEKREEYKVVWTVQLGKKLTARTDDKTFMPVREHVYYFLDSEAYNLRYCEEMICIDIGHMGVTDVSFLEFMPHMKYLILAHTQVQNISPVSNCKELVFFEIDSGPCRDFTPLLECTALEDLNVGNTFADMTPIKGMTWLKNLWMNGRSSWAYEMVEALPDTTIMYSGDATVAGGWRDLDNYFAMRDALGMEYMSW